jgi:hypothetical protein
MPSSVSATSGVQTITSWFRVIISARALSAISKKAHAAPFDGGSVECDVPHDETSTGMSFRAAEQVEYRGSVDAALVRVGDTSRTLRHRCENWSQRLASVSAKGESTAASGRIPRDRNHSGNECGFAGAQEASGIRVSNESGDGT